ncbi:lysophosphatidic acid receptor 6 isoform 1-T2 [Clarias gariepinus]|uniref:lysophosphatidic acid receptor 6 n=1 Tax=Clarias gariepinus TaxID=13013 RepID=UPI00234C84C7|nr:lysophosphatidic acid receptor 6 [Clarias gariepinus]XP_053354307.1 lysophosphatidic acid receptor 6 [Clarias gariepinus]
MSCNSTCQDEAVYRCQNQTNPAFVAMYSVVCIIGIPLNLMALVVFFCCIKSRSHTIVYMTNLALADLLLVCTLPIRIYYHLGIGELSQKTCEVAGLLLLANMYGSILLLTCISIDRCLAVCFPMSSRVREGRKKAPLICLGIWLLTIGASLPPYIINSNKNDTSKTCFRKIPTYAVKPVTLASTLTIGFGIPLIILLLCSWGLVHAVSKSTAAKMSGIVDSCKIQRMVIVNLAIFLCCFLPYHVMLVVIYINNDQMTCSVMSAYYNALMVTCLNTILDPLAYYLTAETFRKNIEIDTVRKMLPMNNLSSDGNTRSKPLVST